MKILIRASYPNYQMIRRYAESGPDVFNWNVDDLNNVRVPVVTANALAGAKWNVTLNGAAVPSGYTGTATVHDGVVYASVARGGTYLIIR